MLRRSATFLTRKALESSHGCNSLPRRCCSIPANLPLTVVVEHIVLFRMKEGALSKSLMNGLVGLRDIEGIIQLYVGSALNMQLSGGWTHALYGRYRDKTALAAYAVHPRHFKVVEDGDDVVEDKLAVDWEATVDREAAFAEFGAARVVLLKCREGAPGEKIAMLMQEFGTCQAVKHSTAGPNFSPARAKGFQWGFAAQFRSAGDLEELQARK